MAAFTSTDGYVPGHGAVLSQLLGVRAIQWIRDHPVDPIPCLKLHNVASRPVPSQFHECDANLTRALQLLQIPLAGSGYRGE